VGRIAELSDLVKRNVEWLDKLVAERGADEILADYVLMNAVLHMLQTAAQAILDMGYRLLSLLGEKPPSSYSEAAGMLEGCGALSREEAALLRKIAGFRNVVVHGYLGINKELVHSILSKGKYRDMLTLASKLLQAAAQISVDP